MSDDALLVQDDRNDELHDMKLEEANPGGLVSIHEVNREEWTEEYYDVAFQTVIASKTFANWTMGMLAYEMIHKFPTVTYERIAQQYHLSKHVVAHWGGVYGVFAKYKDNYIPPTMFPSSVLAMVAKESQKDGTNPVETMEHLEQEGVTSPEASYRKMKERKTGEDVPSKPSFPAKWVDGVWKIDPVSRDERTWAFVDWEYFIDQLMMKVSEDKLRRLEEKLQSRGQ